MSTSTRFDPMFAPCAADHQAAIVQLGGYRGPDKNNPLKRNEAAKQTTMGTLVRFADRQGVSIAANINDLLGMFISAAVLITVDLMIRLCHGC